MTLELENLIPKATGQDELHCDMKGNGSGRRKEFWDTAAVEDRDSEDVQRRTVEGRSGMTRTDYWLCDLGLSGVG